MPGRSTPTSRRDWQDPRCRRGTLALGSYVVLLVGVTATRRGGENAIRHYAGAATRGGGGALASAGRCARLREIELSSKVSACC